MSYKKIALRLNDMGIPSPDAGRVRRDHGSAHRVTGKWHQNTVRDLCTNPIIAGIKEYGRRSEGRYRRVGVGGPRELEEHDLRPDGQPKLLENPEDVRVRAPSGGEAKFDPERWQALQPKKTAIDDVRRKNGRKANNSERCPLSTRVIDLTDGCGSVMHGIPAADKLKYACGRYYNSGYTECNHNWVEATAVTTMLIDALVELVNKAGGRQAVRDRLLTKASAEAEHNAAPEEPAALVQLRRRLAELEDNIATAERRMATEKNEARYEAIAKTFDGLVAEKAAVAREVAELATPKPVTKTSLSPEEQVDALMATIDDLAALAKDENANQKVRDLVLRLGIFVGLEFEERMWGKRPIRALRRGVIAFGEENLPVPIHGRSRADYPAPDAAGNDGSHHTHSAPACCRAPSAKPGSSAGEGTGIDRTDESNSGLEQTHQGTSVGATGLEPATS